MAVIASGGLACPQGIDQIEQSGRLASDPTCINAARLHGRLGEDFDTDVSGKIVAAINLPLKRSAEYNFDYNLIYQTQQVLALIGGAQVALDFEGGDLIEIGYSIMQFGNGTPYSDAAVAAGAWLGSVSLGPGPSWKGFRIWGSCKTGAIGGWLQLKFRSVGVLGLGTPIAKLNRNTTVNAFEC